MIKRAVADLLLFLAIFWTPYWMYIPGIFLGLIFFPLFIEGIILGFFIDTLAGSLLFGPIFSLLVLALQPLREYLRFNV